MVYWGRLFRRSRMTGHSPPVIPRPPRAAVFLDFMTASLYYVCCCYAAAAGRRYFADKESPMIRIASDSTCDLSKELIDRYHITILPLQVLLGSEAYYDGLTITPDEIYAWADANKTTPKTAAPNPEAVADVYRQILDAGDDLVIFSISRSMSACYSILNMVAEESGHPERIRVIDSANLSTGIALQVILAAELAEAGKSLDEIVAAVEEVRPYVRASFVVDTLTYLYRGGRCSGLAALAGGMLRLHPRIAVADGAMSPGKKYRGRMDRVILDYTKDMEEELLKARPDRVFITHSGCTPEVVGSVREYLESLGHFSQILETRAGSVISSHCGPGTLGVLFIAGE